MNAEECMRHMDKAILALKKKLVIKVMQGIDHSLSISHMGLLKFISDYDHCTVSDIANHLNITLSGVTQLTEKLVHMKLVTRTRSEEDRRIVCINITEEGKKLVEKFHQNRAKVFKEWFSILSEEEAKTYFRILEKITSHILSEDNDHESEHH